MRSAWIGVSIVCLTLAAAPARAGEGPSLLADVNPGLRDPSDFFDFTEEPTGFVQVGGRLLFSTANHNFMDEGILWSTDGTAAGTLQASSSLCPGPCDEIDVQAAWRGLAFLRTVSEIQPAELWRSDGTAAGTFPLRGPAGEALAPYEMAGDPASDLIYFAPYTVAYQLWRSDGTQGGTALVRAADANPFDYPASLTFWKGRLYFVAGHQPASGGEVRGLWTTDGTPAGTLFIAEVQEGDAPARLVATPSHLFFTSGPQGKDLWATDGTPGGTHPLADLPDPPCTSPPDPQCDSPDIEPMAAFGDAVYFKNRNGGERVEIWRSDGTASGTGPLVALPAGVTDIGDLHRLAGGWVFPSLPTGPHADDPAELWAADAGFTRAAPLTGCGGGACPALSASLVDTGTGRWFFAGHDPIHGVEPWITDGTGPGTRLLADVCPDACDGILLDTDPHLLAAPSPSGEIYFHAHPTPPESNLPNDELWLTDGTPEGTRRLGGYFSAIGFLGGIAYFGGVSPQRAALELWRTDGTAAGTRRVDVLRRYSAGSSPLFLPFHGGGRFLAAGGDGVFRLWASDGTPEGTVPLRGFELDPPRDAGFALLTRAGNLAFFDVARHGESGDREELWRTDGTPEGTRGLLTLGPRQSIDPLRATWGDRLLFLVDEVHGCSIRTSDGTPAGTRQFLPALPGARCPTVLAPLDPSRLLFVARVETPKGPVPQVFVTDGTVAGTRRITNLHGTREPIDDQAVRIGGTIYFRLGSQTGGAELWRTDGTPERTRQVAPLDSVSPLQIFQGDLYFVAHTPDSNDSGLYRLPPQGPPQLLGAVQPPPEPFDHLPVLAPAGDRLLFVGQDPEHGIELWATDGTPAGTHPLGDLQPGPGSSMPNGLTSAGDRVFFSADDGTHGRELWESDGTPEGTRMVADLAPGGFSAISLGTGFTIADGYLFFAADDGKTGPEPWALRLEP